MFNGDLVAGSLTAGQSTAPLTAIAVILSDDSPEDNEGGAALFSHDVRITSRDFDTGKETVSTLTGGRPPRRAVAGPLRRVQGPGFLAADGPERIIVNYDFNDPAYVGPDPTTIVGWTSTTCWPTTSRSRCGPIARRACAPRRPRR